MLLKLCHQGTGMHLLAPSETSRHSHQQTEAIGSPRLALEASLGTLECFHSRPKAVRAERDPTAVNPPDPETEKKSLNTDKWKVWGPYSSKITAIHVFPSLNLKAKNSILITISCLSMANWVSRDDVDLPEVSEEPWCCRGGGGTGGACLLCDGLGGCGGGFRGGAGGGFLGGGFGRFFIGCCCCCWLVISLSKAPLRLFGRGGKLNGNNGGEDIMLKRTANFNNTTRTTWLQKDVPNI